MSGIKLIFTCVCLIVTFEGIYGHGNLVDPIPRNTVSQINPKIPVNWNYNELFCGGAFFQASQGGKCGVCGDKVTDEPPRDHENGGKYGTGFIVKTYKAGQRATIEVVLTTNHLGYFEFSVCPLSGSKPETEGCFQKVKLATGGYRYKVEDKILNFKIDVILPPGLTCKHCSFRWHYKGGNNWGMCKNGKGKKGCGTQEHFRNCADVAIQ